MPYLSPELAADLRAALAAEAVAAQRYSYFAQIAEIEGVAEVARLFADLAASVACAAHGHLDVLRDATVPDAESDIGETALNLASSIVEALRDADETYPDLLAAAHDEGQADVASWLTTLAALKKAHVGKLNQVLEALPGPAETTAASRPALGGSHD